MSSVGWALVTNGKTDDDNDDIISENPESGENDLCSSDLRGLFGVSDAPSCHLRVTHLMCSLLPLKNQQGSLIREEETVQVHGAESKYPTLQLALPIGQPQELLFIYVQKQMFVLILVDNEKLSTVFHSLYKKAQKLILLS